MGNTACRKVNVASNCFYPVILLVHVTDKLIHRGWICRQRSNSNAIRTGDSLSHELLTQVCLVLKTKQTQL